MQHSSISESKQQPGPLTGAQFGWLGIAALFVIYLAVFSLTRPGGIGEQLWRATYNTAPIIPLAFGTHALLNAQVWPRRLAVVLALQLPLALTFAFAWYLGIIVLRDLPGNWVQDGFAVRPFVPIALVWQMFQGMTLYAVIALASLSLHLSLRLRTAQEAGPAPRPAVPEGLLVKDGNEHHAVEHGEIVRISGAGDYCELHLTGRTIMSTTSLAEFEQRLPDGLFFRAHRSHIVRVGAVTRTEPAGNGRTTLHLLGGSTLVTSRSGTRALREASS